MKLLSLLFFLFTGFCFGMQEDIKNYQRASSLAQRGWDERVFHYANTYKLDFNKPIDEEQNTLMHHIASCEDTLAFDKMVEKAVKIYKGNLFIANKKNETPFMIPICLGNKYNSFKMLEFLDPQILNIHINSNYQSFINHHNEAMQYKQNQENTRAHIEGLLAKQTNNNHSLTIRFTKDQFLATTKCYLLVNPKQFLLLPTIDAQNAALAHELDHYYKIDNTYRVRSSIQDPLELKKFNWGCELDADCAAMWKYPKGTLEYLESLYKANVNDRSTDTLPSFGIRLSIIKSLIERYKIKL